MRASLEDGPGPEAAGVPVQVPPPSLSALFLASLKIGLLSFGGGLSGWIYRDFVQRFRWVSDEDFASSLTLSQMLPGGNVINLMICFGEQLRGPVGSLICCLGLLVGPFFAVLALNAVFHSISDVALLEAVSNGVAFAAIGLMLTICVQGVQRAFRFPPSLVVIALVAIGIGVLNWPLIPVVLGAGALSVFMAWRSAA